MDRILTLVNPEAGQTTGHSTQLELDYFDLVENANDIIYTHDLTGKLTSINKAAERITGYSREEATGTDLIQWLDPASRETALEMLRQKLGGCPRTTYEVTLLTKEGRRVALEVSTRLLFRGGVPVGVQGIARDITDRKRAEMLERDRNRVLQLVAANEPLESVLAGLCRLVERQLGAARCTIRLAENGKPETGGSSDAGFAENQEPQMASNLRRISILADDGSLIGEFLIEAGAFSLDPAQEANVAEAAQRLAVVAIEHRQLADRLEHQATHDPLTGLPNRTLLEKRLEPALGQASAHSRLLALFFIDLDRFKQVNDTLGHATGDRILAEAAHRLASCLRKSDLLARMGGDEFTVVASDLSDSRDAARIAEKILEAFREPFVFEGQELFLTASIGISLFPRDGGDAAVLQRNADAAMYRAKSHGKNGYEFFTPEMGVAALERLELDSTLRRAQERGELQLRYQPQVDRGSRLAGFEALLIWNHSKLGVVQPAQFIPIAEESGLILPIGSWAIEEACRQAAGWVRAGLPRAAVAVNVSAMQFARPDFVETVAQALAETGLDPCLLELELTESLVLRRLEESIRQMERLRALGVRISIDDFGTGYSSLSYLRRLPIHALKIDRSFLHGPVNENSALPLIEAIIALGHGLGLAVVAEGVEDGGQFESLRAAGCDRFQGYLWGEAVPADCAATLLESGVLPGRP